MYIGLFISIGSLESISQHSSKDKSPIFSLRLFSLNILPFTLKKFLISTPYLFTQLFISSLVGVFETIGLISTSILLLLSQSLAFLTLVHFE